MISARPLIRLLTTRGMGALTLFLAVAGAHADESAHVRFGEAQPFSYEGLVQEARALSTQEYVIPDVPEHALIEQIDYLKHGRITFRKDALLWVGAQRQFAVSFFHVGRFFMQPVAINVVKDGMSREMFTSRDAFQIPEDSPAAQMTAERRIAGFKIQEDKNGKLDWQNNDWVAFLGASYFRSIGELYQYGLSARGLAVNPANPNPPFIEEFPHFTKFWIDEDSKSATGVTIYALLESPSVTGAYRFEIDRRKSVIMDISASLFLRRDIARFGLAPLTSMYWFSETAKPGIVDWRPEVHDSDGLSIAKSNGERIWRPLNNPPRVRISSFLDENPRGFGLMQRDPNFFNYVEEGAYERRPSVWVDILGDWGKGAVQLIELPTDDESEDNIVTFWVPETPAKAGQEFNLHYRLTWGAKEPGFPNIGRCIATRIVREPMKYWPANMQKFIVEFQGGPFEKFPANTLLETDMWTSRGHFQDVLIEPLPVDGKILWRVKFALMDFGDSHDPIEMRLAIKKDGAQITETWVYQFNP